MQQQGARNQHTHTIKLLDLYQGPGMQHQRAQMCAVAGCRGSK